MHAPTIRSSRPSPLTSPAPETPIPDWSFGSRRERPGPKLKDADLIGCPIRLTIGAKSLAENTVEFKLRCSGRDKGELVPIDEVVERCLAAISGAQLSPAGCQSWPT